MEDVSGAHAGRAAAEPEVPEGVLGEAVSELRPRRWIEGNWAEFGQVVGDGSGEALPGRGNSMCKVSERSVSTAGGDGTKSGTER